MKSAHYEQLTVIEAEVMHHGDPRMLQPGRDPSFTPEPSSQLRICKIAAKHLHGYRPVKQFVNPAPNFTHAPATQQCLQGVPSGELEPTLHTSLHYLPLRHARSACDS